jgi:hypothetical protein
MDILMDGKNKMIWGLVGLVVLVLIVYYFCRTPSVEGYKHHSLGQAFGGCEFTKSPLDYAFKGPDFQAGNPHLQTKPQSYYAPADLGMVDFYPDTRRLNNGEPMFQDMENNWAGYGGSYIENTNETRDRMTRLGYYAPAQLMAGRAQLAAGANAADLLRIGASPTVKL